MNKRNTNQELIDFTKEWCSTLKSKVEAMKQNDPVVDKPVNDKHFQEYLSSIEAIDKIRQQAVSNFEEEDQLALDIYDHEMQELDDHYAELDAEREPPQADRRFWKQDKNKDAEYKRRTNNIIQNKHLVDGEMKLMKRTLRK